MALFDTEKKNGEALELDQVEIKHHGREIKLLDGKKLYAKIGQPLVLQLGKKELNLFPGSVFVLDFIDKLATGYAEKWLEYNDELKKFSQNASRERFPEFLQKFKEIESNETIPKEEKQKEYFKIFQESGSEIGLQVFTETKKAQESLRIFGKETKFKIVQMILLDAESPGGKWKKNRVAPKEDELNEALSQESFNFDYSQEEFDNLIHVYWQLNFSYDLEKKDILSLRMPL